MKLNNPSTAVFAKVYFARECARAGDKKALSLIEEVKPVVKASNSQAVFAKAEALLAQRRAEAAAQ